MAFTAKWNTRPWSTKTPPLIGDTTRDVTIVENEIANNLGLNALSDLTGAFSTGIYPFYNLRDAQFGAIDGTGATDTTSVIQAVVDAAESDGGGIVLCPPGTYSHTNITVNKPILFLGISRGLDETSAGVQSGLAQFKAHSSIGSAYMFSFASGTTSNVMTDCGMRNLFFHGASLSACLGAINWKGIHDSTIENCNFDQWGGTAVTNGVIHFEGWPTGTTVGCVHNRIQQCRIQIGNSSRTGVWLDGEAGSPSSSSAVQNKLRDMFIIHGGTANSSHGVYLNGACDNNSFIDMHFTNANTTESSSTDFYLANGASSHPRMNTVKRFNGWVTEESSCFGNQYEWRTSEEGGIVYA